jgi:hypothetical protein
MHHFDVGSVAQLPNAHYLFTFPSLPSLFIQSVLIWLNIHSLSMIYTSFPSLLLLLDPLQRSPDFVCVLAVHAPLTLRTSKTPELDPSKEGKYLPRCEHPEGIGHHAAFCALWYRLQYLLLRSMPIDDPSIAHIIFST